MKKAEIIKELEKLYEILTEDAQAVADRENEELERQGYKHRMTTSDTYPYRIGMAESIIKHILND